MKPYYPLFTNLLVIMQAIAAIAGILNWKKLTQIHYKALVVYLGCILIFELVGKYGFMQNLNAKTNYYNYIVIPFQFLFLFWFYYKVHSKYLLFYVFSSIFYLSSLIISSVFYKETILYFQSISYSIANVFISMMVLASFYRLLLSNAILNYKNNLLFYVNVGIMLFYIGTLPFFAFFNLLFKHASIWHGFYSFFLIANNMLYLLYALGLFFHKKNGTSH